MTAPARKPKLQAAPALTSEPPSGFYDEPVSIKGRVPPHDLDSEAAVLSAVLIDSSALDKVLEFLKPEHFYSEAHRRIFEACVAVHGAGKPVDITTVAACLKDRERIKQVGGLPYLTEILSASPAVANIAAHGQTVREKARVRQLIATCQTIAAEGYVDYGGAEDFFARASSAVAAFVPIGGEAPAILHGAELAKPLPPIDWLCSGLKITSGGITKLDGETFSGKSIVGAELGMAVAIGADAFGVFRCRRGDSRYLNWDGQSERISRERFQRLGRAHGVEDLSALGKAIGYLHKPDWYIDTPGARDRMCRLLDGVALLVIDSWRGAAPHVNEWLRGEVQLVGDVLESVSAATGCAIVLIDHTVKPSRDGRSARSAIHDTHGSTAKGELAQSAFSLECSEGDPVRTVRHVKERVTGNPLDPFGLRVEDISRDGDPRWGLRVVHVSPEERAAGEPSAQFDGLKARIVELVRRETGLTSANAIQARLKGAGRPSVLQAIRELKDARALLQPGGEGTPFHAPR